MPASAYFVIELARCRSRRGASSGASSGQRLLGRIAEIGQQAEVELSVPVAEEPHFERLEQSSDALRMREQASGRRPACGDLRRQCPAKNPCAAAAAASRAASQPVDERRRELARAEQRERAQQLEPPARQARPCISAISATPAKTSVISRIAARYWTRAGTGRSTGARAGSAGDAVCHGLLQLRQAPSIR